MSRDIKLYCNSCQKYVGERTEMVMKLLKGTRIEIICTCSECAKPKTDIPDFLMGLLNKR